MAVTGQALRPQRKSNLALRTIKVLGRVTQGLLASAVLAALLAGLPWALVRYLGWPLPDHVPTWDEVQAVLLGPMTTQLLLDVLACLCWIAWTAFTIDTIRCAIDAAKGMRWPERRTRGPMHTLAGLLIGAILIAILGRQPTHFTSTATSSAGGTDDIAVAAVVEHGPFPRVDPRRASTSLSQNGFAAEIVDTRSDVATVVVLPPRDGVHDSLWRIAERTLGDGHRWPQIFTLNKGKPQPDGGKLVNPNRIFPGEVLTLPVRHVDHFGDPEPTTPPEKEAPPTVSPPPTDETPKESPAGETPATDTRRDMADPGVRWGAEVFVGLGLAAAVSAALVVARRRHRSRYRPGSGDRGDLPVAPVVYRLRLAHLHAKAELEDDDLGAIAKPPALTVGEADTDVVEGTAAKEQAIGVRDGQEVALDLAASRGLGLVGDGAAAAARALLITVLSSYQDAGEGAVIVPKPDLVSLLGDHRADVARAGRLRIVDDIDAALDELDAEIVRRTRDHDGNRGTRWPPVALVVRPRVGSTPRLQAVLDNGAAVGVVGVLLGQWRGGVTAYVRGDGTVSATNPGVGERLRDAQAFRLPAAEASDLLALLCYAHPSRESTTSAPEAETRFVEHTDGEQVRPLNCDSALEITAISGSLAEPHQLRSPGGAKPREGRTEVAAPGQRPPAGDVASQLLVVNVFGPPRIRWRPTAEAARDSVKDTPWRDITGGFPPRQRELLVFLALHPDGVSRDAIVASLWPDTPPDRPTNALNTSLSRLRRAVSKATEGTLCEITSLRESHYLLNPELVDVDYWHFSDAVMARRAAATERERVAALRRIVDSYGGQLADGLDTEWIDAARNVTSRDAIDAVAALARAVVDSDPEYTLDLLETARAFDAYNELLYRDIMRLQGRLGHLDAIPRTLSLLTARLSEINERPSRVTIELASRLQRREGVRDHVRPR